MCSGSEAGSYLRLIDFVHHSTQGLRVIKKKKKQENTRASNSGTRESGGAARERELFIDDLLVRIHFIIVMMRWTGFEPWERGYLILIIHSWITHLQA